MITTSTRKFHVCLSVRGALRLPKRKLSKMLRHDDGRSMTPDEAFDALCEELKQGREVIPIGECDNFDYSGGGCQGHPCD